MARGILTKEDGPRSEVDLGTKTKESNPGDRVAFTKIIRWIAALALGLRPGIQGWPGSSPSPIRLRKFRGYR